MTIFGYADHQTCLNYQTGNVEKENKKKLHTHTINQKYKEKYCKTEPSISRFESYKAPIAPQTKRKQNITMIFFDLIFTFSKLTLLLMVIKFRNKFSNRDFFESIRRTQCTIKEILTLRAIKRHHKLNVMKR